jgi:hypothetical protein
MKTIYFKIAVLISFSIILIPGVHVSPPIGLFLAFSLLDSLWGVFTEDINQEMFVNCLITIMLCCSLLFLILRKKLINLVGIIIQFVWMIYVFEYKFLNYWYFAIPASIYLILSLTLLYFLFFKKED